MPNRFDVLENFLRVLIDTLAQGREERTFLASLQQRLAHFLLELSDLVAERRLGDVAALGGPGKAVAVGHGDQITELLDFHRQHLC